MDSKEAEVYLEIAKNRIEEAKLALREERHALCVFLSASSAENATSALLIELGAKPSKKHKNSLVIYRIFPRIINQLQPILRNIIELLKSLEPHITKARYPIRKGLELIPPHQFYTREDAEKALTHAKQTLENCMTAISLMGQAKTALGFSLSH